MRATYQNVWVSTKNHQEAFAKIYQRNSLFRKLIGVYRIPEGFPNMEGFSFIIPLIYQYRCSLFFDEDQILLASNPHFDSFLIRNISNEFKLAIPFTQILSIDLHQNKDIPMSSFNGNKWVKIVFMDESNSKQEILFCEDARSKSNRNAITKRMFNAIRKLFVLSLNKKNQ